MAIWYKDKCAWSVGMNGTFMFQERTKVYKRHEEKHTDNSHL